MNKNQTDENKKGDDFNINESSDYTLTKSDPNDMKKNRKIISDYFKFINTKKNLSNDILKAETINFLNSLNRDITQIYDHDKNNRIVFLLKKFEAVNKYSINLKLKFV